MTDTEILDWLEKNASKLGIKPDWATYDPETLKLLVEFTEIRKKVKRLASSTERRLDFYDT